MTRKDYIVIAAGLREKYLSIGTSTRRQEGFVVALDGICDALKSDNRNFNKDLFLNYIRTGARS